MMEVISLLSHPHPLKLASLNRDGRLCEICRRELSRAGLAYGCERCYYYLICRFCAKLPQKMKHSFHPDHNVVLLKRDSPIGCCACGLTTGSGYLYDCEECSFCLDLRCAALMPTHKYKEGQKVPEIVHQHPLVVCDKPKDYDNYNCSRCYEHFEDDELIYACIECISLLDQKCAAQPSEIKHPFHPEHPLTFLPSPPERSSSHCRVCAGFLSPKRAVYYCSSCCFTIDFHCATLMLAFQNSHPDRREIQFQPTSHPHPLIQCSSSLKNFSHKCYGCGQPFKDSIYACLRCGILLHKSCADLPREIIHQFHPQHPLILYENPPDDNLYRSFNCRACDSGHGDFVYVCQDCDFLLDLRCATAKYLLVKSKLHKHALALFDFECREFPCNICHRLCHKNLFRCVECNFNIHDHCYPSMPKTIKHVCHCDPLTFTATKIMDYPDEDENEEFYCSACEETRNLADPTYYCEECHFVAHVHCVLSEVLPHLETDSVELAKEVENIKLNTSTTVAMENEDIEGGYPAATATEEEKARRAQLVQELSEEIAVLKNNIDSVSERIDQLMEARNQRIATLQHKLNKKTRLTGRRPSVTRQPFHFGYDKTAKVTVSYI